jgi:uncharacterized protein (DUF58 family)
MAATSRSVFPLVPRHRVAGLPLGGAASLRRGHGSDVAGSRAYVAGDPISTIDWRASARLSTARGRDEFVVRERYAEEAPRVVIIADRRPSMRLYGAPFPWLSKPTAVRSVIELIVASASARNAAVAYLDYGGAQARAGEPYWLAPTGRGALGQIETRDAGEPEYDAASNGLELAFEFLGRFRSELSSGTFVFVISDFLGDPVPVATWLTAAARRWEVVPVIVQDPTWEQSFPPVDSVVLPLADAATGELTEVRLSGREARLRREANTGRLAGLEAGFVSLGLSPVLVSTVEPAAIDRLFIDWAAAGRELRRSR